MKHSNPRVVFEEAVDALVVASRDLADGHLFVVPENIALAVNRVSGWLFPEELRPWPKRPGEKPLRVYKWRWGEMEKRYGIPAQMLERIHDLRIEGTYPNHERSDPESPFTESFISQALDDSWQILLTVASAFPPAILSIVQEAKMRAAHLSPEQLLLQDLGQRVHWGLHSPSLRAHLIRLERDLRARPGTGALRNRGLVLAMMCHVSMNQASPETYRSALAIGEQAYALLSHLRYRAGVVYVRGIMSTLVLVQPIPNIGKASRLADEAASWAVEDKSLMHGVTSVRALALRNSNRGLDAVDVLRRDMPWAKAQGPSQAAWLLQQIGTSLASAGKLGRARDVLLEAQDMLPTEFVAAQCIGANALADVCARLALDSEAVAWGDVAARHVVERGLWHQARALRTTMKRFPSIWQGDNQREETR